MNNLLTSKDCETGVLFLFIITRLLSQKKYFFRRAKEFVVHSFAYVTHFVFLRDVWSRTQRAAVASRRATNLATHLPKLKLIWIEESQIRFFSVGNSNLVLKFLQGIHSCCSLFCLCHPFCIFERCLDSNLEMP
jgi:hypothetical protein